MVTAVRSAILATGWLLVAISHVLITHSRLENLFERWRCDGAFTYFWQDL